MRGCGNFRMLVLALGAVLALAGCSPTFTVGELCEAVGEAYCAREEACEGVRLPGCRPDYEATCCAGSRCEEVSTRGLEWLGECEKAIERETCYELSGPMPEECPLSGELARNPGLKTRAQGNQHYAAAPRTSRTNLDPGQADATHVAQATFARGYLSGMKPR